MAALPARYTADQMATYKNGARKGSGSMTTIAKSITSDEIQAAANYFATLKPRQWIRVVEADSLPKTYVAPGNKRLRLPGGGSEPLGDRIIEIPENEEVVLHRDPRLGFIPFVPKGSIAKGKALAEGGGKTIACAICHGPTLQGLGNVPPISGRQATYVIRQLLMIQNGGRSGASVAVDDMLALAATRHRASRSVPVPSPLIATKAGIQQSGSPKLLISRSQTGEPLPDARQQLISQFAIGIEPLPPAALDGARVRRRPVFDVDRAGTGQFERAVMRLRRQGDDQIEIKSLPIFQFLEGRRLVM